jgi:hypothetical protein
MPSAPYHSSVSAARVDALFASPLQRSDEPSAGQVKQAVAAAMGAFGDLGCAARVAQAYGEHPETAVTRMRWACRMVAGAFGGSTPDTARARKPSRYSGTCPAPRLAADNVVWSGVRAVPSQRAGTCEAA